MKLNNSLLVYGYNDRSKMHLMEKLLPLSNVRTTEYKVIGY